MPVLTDVTAYRLAVLEESALRSRTSERVALSYTVMATIRRSSETRAAARKIQAAVLRARRASIRIPRD
jgi:hypothetical protein